MTFSGVNSSCRNGKHASEEGVGKVLTGFLIGIGDFFDSMQEVLDECEKPDPEPEPNQEKQKEERELRTRVYVAGPMSGCEVDYICNIGRMSNWSARLMELGYAPYNPAGDLLAGMAGLIGDVSVYKDCGLSFIDACDVLFVINIQNVTSGVQAEIDLAEEIGVPIVYSLAELISRFPVAK